MSKDISYDGIFKELLDEFPDRNIVELMNSLFERNYPLDAKVARLETESHADGKERRSDKLIQIDDDMFHIEIQSSDDKEIALRVFTYSYRAALQHGKSATPYSLTLDFPKSLVFYIRATEKTPKKIQINLNFPDGNSAEFFAPTRRLNEYTPQKITQGSEVIFAPYYPMLYDGGLKTSEALENFKNEALFIIDKVKEKTSAGEISQRTAEIIVDALEDIMKNVMVKSTIKREEVDAVMEAVEKTYHINILNVEAQAIKKGMQDTLRDVAIKMFKKGYSIEDVQEIITNSDFKTLQKLQKKVLADEAKGKSKPPTL